MCFFADDDADGEYKLNKSNKVDNDDDGNIENYEGDGSDDDVAGDVNDDTDGDGNIEPSELNEKNFIHKLSKILSNNELDISATSTASSATTSSNSEIVQASSERQSDSLRVRDELSTFPYYIYRKKCQMEDDWGLIGLNCTNDDIVIERVVVTGFLVNWMKAFIHIKSEFFAPSDWQIIFFTAHQQLLINTLNFITMV